MSQTLTEKIISQHLGQSVRPGELVIVPVDAVMASDATAPYAIQAFQEMGANRLWRPDKVILVIDHAAPAPNQRISKLHTMILKFAQEKNIQNLDDAYSNMTHDEASEVREKEIREDERKKIMSQQGHATDGNGFASPTLGHLQARVQRGKHDDGLPEDATVTEAAQAAAAELRAEGKVFPD
ncbi:MAG: hypothetical protein IIB03_04745 [Acidobacteria bacterium]|nr:hypothetical protein [Acidobacteriota bacterium]